MYTCRVVSWRVFVEIHPTSIPVVNVLLYYERCLENIFLKKIRTLYVSVSWTGKFDWMSRSSVHTYVCPIYRVAIVKEKSGKTEFSPGQGILAIWLMLGNFVMTVHFFKHFSQSWLGITWPKFHDPHLKIVIK